MRKYPIRIQLRKSYVSFSDRPWGSWLRSLGLYQAKSFRHIYRYRPMQANELWTFRATRKQLSSTLLCAFRATAPTLWAFMATITQPSHTLNLYKVPHAKKIMDLYKVTGNQENWTALALDKVDITHITEKRTSRYIIPLGWVLTDLSHMQRPWEHHHPFQRTLQEINMSRRGDSDDKGLPLLWLIHDSAPTPRTTRRMTRRNNHHATLIYDQY